METTAAGGMIGREADLARLRDALAAGARLVTLVGTGGVGKTRLARTWAETAPGPVRFVACDGARDGGELVATVSAALGLETADDAARLGGALGSGPLTLVLDNLEQVDGAGEPVAALLDAAPVVSVVATSRVPLGIAGEVEQQVRPLPLGGPGDGSAPAVTLFIRRATEAWPAFAATPATLPAIREICALLDGLPLAIELAAARTPVLAPAAMLTRLRQRRTIIDRSVPDLPERQRTLRATVEWSYDLLSPGDQRLFRALGAFAGAFDQDAAGVVAGVDPSGSPAGDVAAGLERLRRASLLSGDDGHYAMLQTVRDQARVLLAADPDAGAVADRHAAWATAVAERTDALSLSDPEATWLTRFDAALADLRQALEHLEAHHPPGALRLAVAMWRYLQQRGLSRDGAALLARLLGREDGDPVEPALRGRALHYLATMRAGLGDLREAERLYREGLALRERVGEPGPIADTLNNLGLALGAMGRLGEAEDVFRRSLALRRQVGDRWGVALALGNLGDLALLAGHPREALGYHRECLAIREEGGDALGITFAHSNIAEAALAAGDIGAARHHRDIAAERLRDIGVPSGEALVARVAGDIARAAGASPVEALPHYLAAAKGYLGIGDRAGMLDALDRLAGVLPQRDAPVAASLLGGVDRLRQQTGGRRPVSETAAAERAEAAIAAALSPADRDLARLAGMAMTDAALVSLAERTVAGLQPADPTAFDETGTTSERAEVPATVAASAPGASRLTRREREVMALVAEGLTNREVAERLFISPATVGDHLRNIFRRLGVTTRTAAAAAWLGHRE